MEGRILRRQAEPKAQPEAPGLVGGTAAIRRMLGRAATITAVALLLGALTLVATSVAGVGVTPAKAWSCRWADKKPNQISKKQARHAVVCAINKQRRKHGRPGLKSSRPLGKASRRHSKYMRKHHCFSHQCSGEPNLIARINRTSYLPCNCTWRVGETIAWGARRKGTPHGIVKAWMRSSEHRRVLMDRKLRQVGIGLVWGSPSNPKQGRAATYTADFGFKRG